MRDKMERVERYFLPCEKQGSVECVRYLSRAYGAEAFYGVEKIPIEKTMYVYLPYGYNPKETYDVLYLMHGGTEDEGYWFGTGRYDVMDQQIYTDAGNVTRHLLDHLIAEGRIRPMIVVTPCFCENVAEYQTRPEYPILYFDVVHHFWKDMKDHIMPYIQEHYGTYAKSCSDADMAAARAHHGFAGASQGSVTGFDSVLLHLSDRIGYLGNFSAGVIRCDVREGNPGMALDQEKLNEIAQALETEELPLFWYNGCGDQDPMLEHHKATYDWLMRHSRLRETDSIFEIREGGKHEYRNWIYDLYEVLVRFFR